MDSIWDNKLGLELVLDDLVDVQHIVVLALPLEGRDEMLVLTDKDDGDAMVVHSSDFKFEYIYPSLLEDDEAGDITILIRVN